LLRFL